MSNTNDPPLPPSGANSPVEQPEYPLPQQQPLPGIDAMRRQSGALPTAPMQVPSPGMVMTSGAAEGASSTDDIFRTLLLIWRHKILVACLTLVATLTGFLLSQRVTPIYQSQARLSIVYKGPTRNDWDPGPTDVEYQRNFESILREATSRTVLLKAAEKIIENQDVPTLKELSKSDIADALGGGASVDPVTKTTHVMYNFVSQNRDEAPIILGYLVNAFKIDQAQSATINYDQKGQDLAADTAQKRKEYDDALKSYNDYRFKYHLNDTDASPVRYLQQMQDLKRNLSAADEEVTRKEKFLAAIDPADEDKLLDWMKATANIGWMWQQTQAELSDLTKRLGERLQVYTMGDPECQRLEAARVAKRQELVNLARERYKQETTDLDASRTTQTNIQKSIDELKLQMDEMLPILNQAQILKEQADIAKKSWEVLADRKTEAANTADRQFTVIKSIEPITSAERIYPRVSTFVIMGGLIGLVISIVIVVFWTRIDDTLKTSVQVPQQLGIPTLGTVLFSPAIGPDPSGLPLVARLPRSPEAEALFIVWANISTRLNLQPGVCKVLMLTSSIPEEGKSTTSANLASVAAQQNLRVLLIDLDLRRPSLHNYFGVTNAVGCIQALNRHMRREQCIQRTAVKNLDILTTGLGEDHPNELVSPQNLMGLLAWARANYDLVVLDTPPLLLAADGLIVSRFIDGAVLVIHGGQTPLDTVQRSRDMLLGANTNLLGAILNDRTGAADERDRSYYYKYSAYYHQTSAND